MNKEITLKGGWITLAKEELDALRRRIREVYVSEGGSKKFNTYLDNYEELRTMIQRRLGEMTRDEERSISFQEYTAAEMVPGNTFFKDLFYTRRKHQTARFQEGNIEICYLYAFGMMRMEYLKRSRVTQAPIGQRPNIIVSSTLNNMTEAEKIKHHLSEKFGLHVESDIRNTHAFSKGTLENFYESLPPDSLVFALVSRDYLQNESCVRDLISLTRKDLDLYLSRTFHILLPDVYQGDFNIFDSLGRSELLKYWKLRIEKLEENHKLILRGKKDKALYKILATELAEIKEIIEELHRLIDLIRENHSKTLFEIFFSKINSLEELIELFPKKKAISSIDIELETTYKRIKIPSTNNPQKPEFPPEPFYTPKFPASETYRVKVPGFDNVWLKDESTNPTGTHKDRLAWEVVIKYRSLIEGLKYKDQDSLPQMSMISSGSAAIAIQHLFNLYEIPRPLKVLVDRQLAGPIKDEVLAIGCELYEYDLSEKLLSPEEIKKLTDNENGIDITYREVLDPTHDNYYDWMSYEILREKADYCFIPFGTGDLFINVLNIVKVEYFNSFVQKHDPRFFTSMKALRRCHFMGASTKNPETRLDKLFSNFLPSIDSFHRFIRELKNDYACVGPLTNIYYVDERNVDAALKIADQQNLKYEPSGMAGLALLLQLAPQIDPEAKILIVNTGRTRSIAELKREFDQESD